MKIVLVQVIYNEIKMLPWKMKWAAENGIEIFTFDNYSSDGSTEWLEKNGCDFEMLDTGGMFSLRKNNEAITKKLYQLNPDWCLVAGCDMFYKLLDYDIKLNKFIEIAEQQGYNAIDCSRLFNFYYTGTENDNKDPRKQYFYYEEKSDWKISLIAKYDKSLWIDGDQFFVRDRTLFEYPNFVCLHYWHRSDARERFISKWQRRYKSWQEGIDIKNHGRHYPDIIMKDKWIYEPGELKDIRELKAKI